MISIILENHTMPYIHNNGKAAGWRKTNVTLDGRYQRLTEEKHTRSAFRYKVRQHEPQEQYMPVAQSKVSKAKIAKYTAAVVSAAGVVGGITGGLLSPVNNAFTTQPSLGKTEEEEWAIFSEMLKPFKDLPEDQREKAVLILIQDRLKSHIQYGYDKDSEGVEEYISNSEEIMQDGGQYIDCEDYSMLCERWSEIAKKEGLLPKNAEFRSVFINTPENDNGHVLFIYETPSSTVEGESEYYVIDTFTTFNSLGENANKLDAISAGKFDSNNDDLVSLQEYLENTNFELKPDYGTYDISYDPLNPGEKVLIDLFMSKEWKENIGVEHTLGQSISRKDIVNIQQNYIETYGEPVLPADFDAEVMSKQIRLLEIEKFVGTYSFTLNRNITAEDLSVTAEEAQQLIGVYSQKLDKIFEVADLGFNDKEAQSWVGEHSEALGRSLTYEDLGIDPPTEAAAVSEAGTFSSTVEINQIEADTAPLEALGLDVADLANPISAGLEGGSAIVEGAVIAAMAARKLYTIKTRQQNIKQAFKAKERWSNAPKDKLLSENDFKDFASLCFLEQEVKDEQSTSNEKNVQPPSLSKIKSSKPYNENEELKHILSMGNSYVDADEVRDFYANLSTFLINAENQDKNKNEISAMREFSNGLLLDQSNYFYTQKHLKEINKSLSNIGINIDYKTDKIWGKFRSSSKPFCHKITIDYTKFYQCLQKQNLLPVSTDIHNMLTKYDKEIDAIYTLKDYDNWKVFQHKVDRNLKLASAAIGLIPLPFDEIIKSVAYGKEVKYRDNNKSRMNKRVDDGLSMVEQSNVFDKNELNKLRQMLNNARGVKLAHMDIKKHHSTTSSTIHAAAAATSIPAKLLGPIGTGMKTGLKAVAKVTASVAATVSRKRKDAAFKKENKMVKVIEIYKYYKTLYKEAQASGNEKKVEAIIQLAQKTFGISSSGFEALVKTRLVENNRFKLSFSQRE